MTQASILEDLREHLLDLHQELNLGVIPNVRRHSVLEAANSTPPKPQEEAQGVLRLGPKRAR